MPARKLTTDIGSLQAHSNGSRPVKHRHIVSGFESIEHHYQALIKAVVASGGVANAGTVTLSGGVVQVQNRWGINLEGTLALWLENESLSLGTLSTGVKYRVVITPNPVEETLSFSYQPPGASAENLTHVLRLRLGKLVLLAGDSTNYPAIPADSLPVCKITGPGTLDEIENPPILPRGLGRGTTAQRPIPLAASEIPYFDTTLNKPIWWDGTNWRDATGAIV